MDFHNDGSTSDPLSLLESFQTLDQTKVFILEAQMTGRFTCNPTIDNGSDAWGSPKKNSCLILGKLISGSYMHILFAHIQTPAG